MTHLPKGYGDGVGYYYGNESLHMDGDGYEHYHTGNDNGNGGWGYRHGNGLGFYPDYAILELSHAAN